MNALPYLTMIERPPSLENVEPSQHKDNDEISSEPVSAHEHAFGQVPWGQHAPGW